MKRPDLSRFSVSRKYTGGADDGLHESVVRVGDVTLDRARPLVIAGPCAVESRDQTLGVARLVADAGADMLRGGAWKPRTSPLSFQGLGEKALEILAEARAETGLPVVTEVMDPRLVGVVGEVADVLQVGSRNMQNFPLLVEVGRYGKPVLLKRGFSATVEEWLGAAEYIAREGNPRIILCERGVRTFASGDYVRNTLDLAVLQAVREVSWLPVIVDPSHATGDWRLVPAACSAALAYGAHGLLIDVAATAADRRKARCDGEQAILPPQLKRIVREARAVESRGATGAVTHRA